MTANEYWQNFLLETGRDASLKYKDCYHFCNSEESANDLLELVLDGKKRATSSLAIAYEIEGDALPIAGDFCILTDWDGNPRCVIQNTAVTIMPFKDMSYDVCKREGEDENLESWRNNHIKAFCAECTELAIAFSYELMVVFEDFEVVYR